MGVLSHRNFSGISMSSIALAIRSFNPSLFTRLIVRYSLV